jgi:hypothetical protein
LHVYLLLIILKDDWSFGCEWMTYLICNISNNQYCYNKHYDSGHFWILYHVHICHVSYNRIADETYRRMWIHSSINCTYFSESANVTIEKCVQNYHQPKSSSDFLFFVMKENSLLFGKSQVIGKLICIDFCFEINHEFDTHPFVKL